MQTPFDADFYHAVSQTWPATGKVILGTFSSDTIILYQAYRKDIADWAATHKTFLGCPTFKMERMTWVKPNFLWMMYRSGWATKRNQERILAITIKLSGFMEILGNASTNPERTIADADDTTGTTTVRDDVRLQWDPDHDPYGNKMERRAIQLGLRGEILGKFLNEWIVDIHDITDFVQQQFQFVQNQNLDLLKVPNEKIFEIKDDNLRKYIGADQ
ncbi:uncharacterized protein LOC110845682 [Folsomia candida]|uniref:uncharacterized protein LOC110845682 n=1 Tax=Folsomia candida TaxID=158441 RepID=UPI000B90A05E|nr:uncharacterized protein LOC110845682 [Folsomia candida]